MKVSGTYLATSSLATDRAGKDRSEVSELCRLQLLWLFILFADKVTEV